MLLPVSSFLQWVQLRELSIAGFELENNRLLRPRYLLPWAPLVQNQCQIQQAWNKLWPTTNRALPQILCLISIARVRITEALRNKSLSVTAVVTLTSFLSRPTQEMSDSTVKAYWMCQDCRLTQLPPIYCRKLKEAAWKPAHRMTRAIYVIFWKN